MTARRFLTGLGVSAVTAVAGGISYDHQRNLAREHAQNAAAAAVWPLCVDGLVLSCGILIAADRAEGKKPRTWAVAGFWLGVAVSVITNWLATDGGFINHGVSAFPAIAFLISVEALSGKPRERQAKQAEAEPKTVEKATARPRKGWAKAAETKALAAKFPAATPAELGAKLGRSESTVRRHLRAA